MPVAALGGYLGEEYFPLSVLWKKQASHVAIPAGLSDHSLLLVLVVSGNINIVRNMVQDSTS